ncbi:MAG: hypothetical protein EBX95_07330 [Acidimicrobiia bacterium]|nr:hypothetical protein [Acidimicrobiia bacterium]
MNGNTSLTVFPVAGAAAAFFGGSVAPGGSDFGTGIGFIASALTFTLGATSFFPPFSASRMDRRLLSPRTGVRLTKTHPTFGTGLPPISRPSSNNHGY